MGKVPNMPDPDAPALIAGELGELLVQIEKEKAPERLLELAVQLQAALLRRHTRPETGSVVMNV